MQLSVGMDVKVGKEAGIARFLKAGDFERDRRAEAGNSTHAGMGALVTPRHVITCAHVVNVAIGRHKTDTRRPSRAVDVVFPLSANPRTPFSAHVIEWHPIDHKDTPDVAVLELDKDAPASAGLTVFSLVGSALEFDRLLVFGTLSGHAGLDYVSTNFVGSTRDAQVQMARDVRNVSPGDTEKLENDAKLIRGGFSGAAVWDISRDAAIGMVTAHNDDVDDFAYMIPAGRLVRAWPALAVETRRLPKSFDAIWSALAFILFSAMFLLFLANRHTVEGQPDILSPFWGLHVYAFLGTIVSGLWCIHAKDFKLHDWASKVPRFLAIPIERGSFAAKTSAALTLFFMMFATMVMEAHFIDVLNNRGHVYIYPEQFGFTTDELQNCIPRETPLCRHADAGLYSTVKPRPQATGGYWDNAYHYGGDKNGSTVTFFPILQPLVLQGLALVALLIQVVAFVRTFWRGDWSPFERKTWRSR